MEKTGGKRNHSKNNQKYSVLLIMIVVKIWVGMVEVNKHDLPEKREQEGYQVCKFCHPSCFKKLRM